MAIPQDQLKAALEPLIDANSAQSVLAAIAEVMHEKAEHSGSLAVAGEQLPS